MNKFITHNDKTMVILHEEDITNKSIFVHGYGIDILVLPIKYKAIQNDYLDTLIQSITCKQFNKIIYI